MDKNPYPTKNVLKFNIQKEGIKDYLSNTIPVPTMKEYPKESDYNEGYFTRYFSKNIYDLGYQEIEKDVYESIYQRKGTYDHNLNEIGNLRWALVNNVFKENSLELQRKELQYKNISHLYIQLNEFQKPNLQNQENLYTEGGELYYADGTEYIGSYHIHTTQGPMEGPYHTDILHHKLYYTNQLPAPYNTTYEDWLASLRPTIGSHPGQEPEREILEAIIPTSFNCITIWDEPEDQGYAGLTNIDGLVPSGTSCVDPGDGTGFYHYNDYGDDTLTTCQSNCSGTVYGTIQYGCMFPFDSNYCSGCTAHNADLCHLEYYNYMHENTCFCGNYGNHGYYNYACCFLPGAYNPWD